MIQTSLPAAFAKIANDLALASNAKDIAKELSSFKLTEPSTRLEGGVCIFQNENYTIRCNDDNEITIENRHDDKSMRIWGDPHVEVNQQHVFDFWGTTTFHLLDGTKVTINTTPWEVNPGMRLATSITITDGKYGVQITGIDSNTRNDLRFREYFDAGEQLDQRVDDGNLLYEDNEPIAFFAIDSVGNVHVADQAYINETDLARTLELVHRYAYYFRYMHNLDSITLRGALLAVSNAMQREQDNRHVPRLRTHVIRKLIELNDQASISTLEDQNKDQLKSKHLPLRLRIERFSTRSRDTNLG